LPFFLSKGRRAGFFFRPLSILTQKSPHKKALVIRFNAIGDIVLTTHITKVWKFSNNLSELMSELKKESFDCVIDLHNNIRSKKVSSGLDAEVHRFKKDRVADWMLTKLSIGKYQKDHIVQRFLKVIEPLGIKVDNPQPAFCFSESKKADLTLPENYMAIAVGAAWKTKQIPTDKIVNIIQQSKWKEIVLVGGPDDEATAQEICESTHKPIKNLVGQLSISDSARVIQQAEILLSGDTGMMHIAAALETPIVAVFASTHPLLGYVPYAESSNYEIVQNNALSCRPCTKQGKKACPKGHFKCMIDLDYTDLVRKIDRYI